MSLLSCWMLLAYFISLFQRFCVNFKSRCEEACFLFLRLCSKDIWKVFPLGMTITAKCFSYRWSDFRVASVKFYFPNKMNSSISLNSVFPLLLPLQIQYPVPSGSLQKKENGKQEPTIFSPKSEAGFQCCSHILVRYHCWLWPASTKQGWNPYWISVEIRNKQMFEIFVLLVTENFLGFQSKTYFRVALIIEVYYVLVAEKRMHVLAVINTNALLYCSDAICN